MPKRRDFKRSEEELKGIEEAVAHNQRLEVAKRTLALPKLHRRQCRQSPTGCTLTLPYGIRYNAAILGL